MVTDDATAKTADPHVVVVVVVAAAASNVVDDVIADVVATYCGGGAPIMLLSLAGDVVAIAKGDSYYNTDHQRRRAVV